MAATTIQKAYTFSLTFCLTDCAATLTALCDIEEGEELFISYGNFYWSSKEETLADPAVSPETGVLSTYELMRTRSPSERCAVSVGAHHLRPRHHSQKVGICSLPITTTRFEFSRIFKKSAQKDGCEVIYGYCRVSTGAGERGHVSRGAGRSVEKVRSRTHLRRYERIGCEGRSPELGAMLDRCAKATL